MKTLDEVIERFEDDLHAAEADSQLIMLFDRDVADALHYLKEYSSKQDTIAEQLAELEQKNDHVCELAKTVGEEYDRLCNRLAEEYRNDALTWDELKQMEGNSVWYEHEFWKGWIILGKVEQGVNCEMIPDREERWYIVKDGSAKAYRKERE